jgi:hypothetical protein
MDINCPSCGVKLKAKDELAGKSRNCPKCGSVIEIPKPAPPPRKPSGPLATERQKDYATTLGIQFTPDVTRREISDLIDAAVDRRDEDRMRRLDELGSRESEAWQKMREEVLAEIDQDDCRLSKATAAQIVEEFANRDQGAILIWFGIDDIDFDDLAGAKFTISFSENMTEKEMGFVVLAARYMLARRAGQ